MTMPSTFDRPSIASASRDVVVSMRRVVAAIVREEATRIESRFVATWRGALMLIPLTVLATAAFVYLVAGIENALTDAAGWPLWLARLTVAGVLAVVAGLVGFIVSRRWRQGAALSFNANLPIERVSP